MITIKFKYNCGDYVTITAYGLNYRGRVQECIWDGAKKYDVEYAYDGGINQRQFYEDELCK